MLEFLIAKKKTKKKLILLLLIVFSSFANASCPCAQGKDYGNTILEGKIPPDNIRYDTFNCALNLLDTKKDPVIIETGTARMGKEWCLTDGCSTFIFAEWVEKNGGTLFSVDISKESIQTCKSALKAQQRFVTFAQSDSVVFLQKFNKQIDFLYLDSFDFDENNPIPSQEHHLKEIIAAYPHLTPNSVVMIDDCDLPYGGENYGGKGKLVIEYLVAKGWKIVMQEYQAILVFPEAEFPPRIPKISAEPNEVLNFVKSYLPTDPVILECGGYNGADTVRMANIWPQGTIYTFEAIPDHCTNICKAIKKYPNVKAFPLALADKTGVLPFYLSRFPTKQLAASSSLLPVKDHVKFDNHVSFGGSIDVNAITLDDWAAQEGVTHIDFMWLDMQGSELNMLKVSEIAKKTKVIYTEAEFIEAYEGQYLYPALKQWMLDNGFTLIALDFDETFGLLGDKIVTPSLGVLYYGNAIFLNTGLK